MLTFWLRASEKPIEEPVSHARRQGFFYLMGGDDILAVGIEADSPTAEPREQSCIARKQRQ